MKTKLASRRHVIALTGALATMAILPARADSPPETLVPDFTGKKLRVIRPGEMVTMDYSDQRVNVEVDDQGLIKRVYIG